MAEKEGFEPTEPRGSDALQAPAFDHSATSPHATANIISQLFRIAIPGKPIFLLAEKVGFEPTGQQAAQLISSQSPSTTRALLRTEKYYTRSFSACQVERVQVDCPKNETPNTLFLFQIRFSTPPSGWSIFIFPSFDK